MKQIQEIIQIIQADGWYLLDENGSYRQYKHPHKTGRITIAGNLNYDLALDSINSILRHAGLPGMKP
jgi:predicted RNA binding protein YcfA (HicA-like mRNA interferase family)